MRFNLFGLYVYGVICEICRRFFCEDLYIVQGEIMRYNVDKKSWCIEIR